MWESSVPAWLHSCHLCRAQCATTNLYLADLLHDSLTVLGHIVDFKSLQIVPSLAQALAFGKTTKLSAGWVGTQTTFFFKLQYTVSKKSREVMLTSTLYYGNPLRT